MSRWRIGMAIAAGVVFLLAGSVPAFAGWRSREYRVKAAFLIKFLEYVEWPESSFERAGAPVVMAIVGDDPFGEELDAIAAQSTTAAGRPIRIARYPDPREMTVEQRSKLVNGSHLVFFSADDPEAGIKLVVDWLGRRSVVTAGETEAFAAAGGIIRFVILDRTVRFEINLAAARDRELKISSKLLNLANKVSK